MRVAFIFLAALLVAACSNETAGAAKAPADYGPEDAKLKAVLMYADWCPSCRALDPKLAAVRALQIDGVRYVTLDYTRKDVDAVLAAADAAGVGPAIRDRFERKIKTGLVLLVDADAMTIVGEIDRSLSVDDIADAVRKAVAAA
ncbi:MAG: hypothetical protein AAGC56_01905 [Pseudomonadota bacterium]